MNIVFFFAYQEISNIGNGLTQFLPVTAEGMFFKETILPVVNQKIQDHLY